MRDMKPVNFGKTEAGEDVNYEYENRTKETDSIIWKNDVWR